LPLPSGVEIKVVKRRRDPNGRHTHTGQIAQLLLNTGKVACPVEMPVGLGRIKEASTLRRIVVGAITVEETVCHNLVDNLLLKILSKELIRQ